MDSGARSWRRPARLMIVNQMNFPFWNSNFLKSSSMLLMIDLQISSGMNTGNVVIVKLMRTNCDMVSWMFELEERADALL